jgi:hypothetical protein
MMDEVHTSETSVHFNVTTRRYIPQNSKLHILKAVKGIDLEMTTQTRTLKYYELKIYNAVIATGSK